MSPGTFEVLQEYDFPGGTNETCFRKFEKRKSLHKSRGQLSLDQVSKLFNLQVGCRPKSFDKPWKFAVGRYKKLPGCPA